ncbi:MAG TPA: ABC transporter substrate-binding protein [Casimicrobiaceae bacterium]|nr:ABC transporter substrate-binding protein [Casimicrobiaceae bacterium]
MERMIRMLALLAVLAACWPFATYGQKAGQPVRIGWISAGNLETHRPMVDAFHQGMKDLGHIEGKTYVVDFRWGFDTFKSYTWMAHEMMARQPDVIVATCEYTSSASLRATSQVPVVMAISGDPVKLGYVKSLSAPGTNVTGLAAISPTLAAKRLELLKEVLPSARRIAVLHQPDDETSHHGLAQARTAATALGIELVVFEASDPRDYPRAFDAIRAAKPDALLVMAGTQIAFINRRALARHTLDARMPTSFPFYEFVEEGGLMSYGVDIRAQFRRSASYVDRLIKGARPSELAMEQPTHFEMTVNRKTAQALGVAIPSSILVRADRVVE